MSGIKKIFKVPGIVAVLLLIIQSAAYCATTRYDLVYIWDRDIENVLDYKEQLEALFDDKTNKRLKIVGRGNEFGIIYDTNGSALSAGHEIALQGSLLRNAGLKEAWAIRDEGYHRLYNVSYGLGPNLDALKDTYTQLYGYLGKEVGKLLFIEKTSANNYTLIYRRRGDKSSTLEVAKKHAKLLKSKRIKTSITPENNNDIVYGESSLLNDEPPQLSDADALTEGKVVPVSAQVAKEITPPTKQIAEVKYIKRTKKKRLRRVARTTGFEKDVESFIKDLRRKGQIRGDERTGWMVYDLENNRSLVDINANRQFQAASMIKPFVALAFFHQVKAGKLKYGPKSKRKIEAMIQRSSNSATNWVMKQVGGPYSCQRILRKNYRSIFKNTTIKEYIPASGRTYKNSALPSDYIRFLKALWNKKLPYSRELRRIMALPGRDRLYHGTPIPQGTLVYNKTGSTAHLCGDMGILVPKTSSGKRHPYAIVGIIERSSRPKDYGNWMLARGNVIRNVSTLVYKEMKKKYKLR